MGYLEATCKGANSHLYSQALQMKLYQAFIFSIPILFSIILFLLFYLFYLKRNFNTATSSSLQRMLRNHDSSTLLQSSEIVSKVNLEGKLVMILFDEDLHAKDSMCCVCLGEFEINEKLHQIPSCQHMFHVDCIRSWLHSNATCPLCRCSVTPTVVANHHEPPMAHEPATTDHLNSTPQHVPQEHSVVIFEGSSSASIDNKLCNSNDEFVVVNIRTHDV